MRRRWPLIGVVVGIATLIDVVLLPRTGHAAPVWLQILTVSFASGQGSLLGIWAALGGKATPWRLVAGFVGAGACTWMLGEPDLVFWACLLLVQLVAMSALLLPARLLGLELADDFRHRSAGSSAPNGQWVQYSVRSLLSWTTACGVLLATCHYLPGDSFSDLFREPALRVAVVVSGVATALGVLWICLGARWPAVRVASLGLTAAAGVTTLWLGVGSQGEPWEFFAFCLFQAVYLVGSLWLIRLAGYRLVWRRRVRL